MRLLILIVLAFCFGTVNARADLSSLQEAAQYADPLIVNGTGSLTYFWTRVDSTSAHAVMRREKAFEAVPSSGRLSRANQSRISIYFAFSGRKMRCNEREMNLFPDGKSFKRNWQSAYNGEKMDLLRLDGIGKNGLVVPFASTQANNIISVEKFDPRYHAITIFGVSVGDFLKGVAKEGPLVNMVQKADESVDGISCNVINGTVANTDTVYTVWIAPSQMYRPRKIEVRTSDGLKTVYNQFVKHSGDVWFPKQTVVEQYYFSETTGLPVLEKKSILTVGDDYVVNTDVPESLFSINFKPKMRVYDWRTGTTSVAK